MKADSIQTIILFLATMLFVSCRENAPADTDMFQGGTKVTLSVSGPAGMATEPSAISKFNIYRFDNDVLAEMLDGLVPDASGHCRMHFEKQTGTIYCLANLPEGVTAGRFIPGETLLNDFVSFTVSDTAMASGDHIALVGRQTLYQSNKVTWIPLTRPVARVDLSTSLKNVQVHRVKVKHIADRGCLHPEPDNMAPQGVQYKDSLFEYSEPLVETTRTLVYLCEQESRDLEFEIFASSDGASYKLKARLPKIVRNTIYTLKVRNNGIKLEVDVQDCDWNTGTETESNPEATASPVDAEASVLPEGVRLNATYDTLYISPRPLNFDLALSVAEGGHVEVNGQAQGVASTVLPPSGALPQVVRVDVTRSRLIGRPEEKIFVDVLSGNTLTGRVVLLFEPHPVLLTGRLRFKDAPEFDFEEYVEGELGVLTLPDGWTASVSTAPEKPWMKLIPAEEAPGRMRILAGWRPNDPLADGRPQEAALMLSDGINTDTYTIKRRNWGLPVVNVDGTWWCKYNLRGNGTRFADQILPTNDPLTAGRSLYEYLQSCPDSELFPLLGDQYQGGYPQGLPLAWDAANSAFYYEGMRGSASNFADTADNLMVPPGYRLPGYEDYRAFLSSDNLYLGGVGSRTIQNSQGKDVTYSIFMRDIRFLGQSYGKTGFYEFQTGHDTDKIVLCGLGHQYETTHGRLAPMSIILAVKDPKSCIIAGSPQDETSRMSFADQNSRKTRTLRAIKLPVEYTY